MIATPRVAIRVDASAAIGTGHLKRCLSLAQALAEAGAKVIFVCRSLDAVAKQMLAAQNVNVCWLSAAAGGLALEPDAPPHAAWAIVPQSYDAENTVQALSGWHPDWVVVDHYALDARWHEAVRAALGCQLLAIDDTADRPLAPDALLDHNCAPNHRAKYAGRLLREPLWLSGPRFALLSSAYQQAPRYAFHETVRSIGIFMGGVDPGGMSARALAACRSAGFTGPVEVVSTSFNPHLPGLREACAADAQTTLTLDAPDLATFFARHDLQIGAGGGATWERCCLGAPTLLLIGAQNQRAVVPMISEMGAVCVPDPIEATDVPAIAAALGRLLEDAPSRLDLAHRASTLVDGLGARRVALALCAAAIRLRLATKCDAELMHRWRNHPTTRAVSHDGAEISLQAHLTWLSDALLRNPQRTLMMAYVGGLPVGVIRFDAQPDGFAVVSLYLDPALHGLGLGSRMLAAAECEMVSTGLAPNGFAASVFAGNEASLRMFKAGGYEPTEGRWVKSHAAKGE